MAEAIRSFIAFDINNESILQRMKDFQTQLAKVGADLKLVEPENIHVTLRFLGNITPATAEKIFEGMKKLQFVPFDVKIHGVGAFPDLRYPRVLWAGITQGSDELRGIFGQLEPRLRSLGFAADPKGFSPHLTVARVKSGRNKADLAKIMVENADYDFGIMKAQCIKLKRSDLTPRGPIYSTLKEFCPEA